MIPGAAPAYDIARATGVCAASGALLQPDDPIVVALCEREGDEGLDRLDFSAPAWDALPSEQRSRFEGRAIFAHWRAAQPAPNTKPKFLVDDDSLLDLFEQTTEEAGGADDRRRATFRYVLGLILCRKRLLVLERSEPGAILVRRRTRKDEPVAPLIRVEDPGLDEQTIVIATEQLGAALAGGA